MNKILYLLSTVAVILFGACQKQPNMGTTAIYPMDGEWKVKIYDISTNTPINANPYTIYTSNTANNDKNTLLLRATLNGNATNNATNGAPIVGKVMCSVADKTFSITDGILLNSNTTTIVPPNNLFSISGGKILLNAAHPPSGTTADSITFFIEKRGASTIKYRISGFRRTFWHEDESW